MEGDKAEDLELSPECKFSMKLYYRNEIIGRV